MMYVIEIIEEKQYVSILYLHIKKLNIFGLLLI